MHYLKHRNKGAKPPGQAQASAIPPSTGGNSPTTSIPTLNVPSPSRIGRIRDGAVSIFGFTSRRSSRASSPAPPSSPANVTQHDTTLSVPQKLGELLQQEASNLWTKAYDELPIEYKQDLGCMGNTDSDKPEKLDALKQLLEHAMEAQRENTASQWKVKWGSREINVREKAEKLMSWITKFKEIGDIVVQYDPVHAALPWAGIRSILIFVTAEQQNLQYAVIAMERITFLVSRCAIYEKLYLIECEPPGPAAKAINDLRRALVILYTAILRALSLCIRVFNGNIWDKLRSPDATFEEITALDAPESNVTSAVQTVENCYNALARTENKEAFNKLKMLLEDISSILSRIGEKVTTINKTVTAVYERIQETERVAILQWFSVIPYQGHHDLASESRVAGTGQWLFQRKEFRHWQQSKESSILWLHGIPGAGKTKLVSATIDHLHERKVAYFYCKRDEEVRRDRHITLLSLVKQLACPPNESAIYTEVLQAYRNEQKDPSARKNLPVHDCLNLLLILLEYYKDAVIVLDALDECSKESRGFILSDLLSILNKSKHPVKAFISSRHSLEIEDRLRHFPNVSIEAKDNADDIENYVESTLAKRIEDKELLRGHVSMELRQRIAEVLQRDANGMFLWVDYQIRELCNLRFERDVRARLGKLPKDLTGVYNEIIDSIMRQPGSSPEIATRALKWMVVAQRPLVPSELITAAELDPAAVVALDSSVGAPDLTLDIDLLIHLCEGLLLWDKQLDVIRFSHLSVQEYLETESMNQYWDIIDAHHLVMEACLWTLQCPYPPEKVPLYHYAALHWLHHCRSYQDLVVQSAASNKRPKHTLDVPLLRDFLCSFSKPTASYEKWVHSLPKITSHITIEVDYLAKLPVYPAFSAALGGLGELVNWLWLAKDVDIHVTDGKGKPLLNYAIVSGSEELVNRMIAMGTDINLTRQLGSALYVAVECNNPNMVSILLDRGADINTIGGNNGTALGCAAFGEKVDLVSLLLERGADINVAGGIYGTALSCAAYNGNVNLLSLLLERGADTNVVSGLWGTALGCAAFMGEVDTVSLLLERGADTNVVSRLWGTALGCAALIGQVDIVSLLLERGADINAVGGAYGTALGCAAYNGQVDTASQLIERGADINAVGGDYGTALGCAAYNGKVDTASLLLERGADINAIGGDYGTALGSAAYNGKVDTASQLIERGADIHIIGGRYVTALGCAAWKGNVELVSLFLERGADINAVGGYYGTALGCAAYQGNMELVSLILERGANIHVIGGKYGTALGCAAYAGRKELASLLLERGTEINAVGGDYETALSCAAFMGEVDTVSLLLERGADINAVGGDYGTALGCAAYNGKVDTASQLIERGADINVIGGKYGTPLGCAAYRGEVELVSLLLERGADINAVGGDYGTALGCAAYRGEVDAASLLFERGAGINIIGGKYRTPLGTSASSGHIETVKLLMKHGAKPDLTSDDGMTARAWAERKGHSDIVQFLDSWDGSLSDCVGLGEGHSPAAGGNLSNA